MEIKCLFQEKTSEKTGRTYYVLYVPELEKTIFLEPCETKLLKLMHTDNI